MLHLLQVLKGVVVKSLGPKHSQSLNLGSATNKLALGKFATYHLGKLPLTTRVPLHNLHNLSVPQFPHLDNGVYHSTYFIGFFVTTQDQVSQYI